MNAEDRLLLKQVKKQLECNEALAKTNEVNNKIIATQLEQIRLLKEIHATQKELIEVLEYEVFCLGLDKVL